MQKILLQDHSVSKNLQSTFVRLLKRTYKVEDAHALALSGAQRQQRPGRPSKALRRYKASCHSPLYESKKRQLS